MASVGVGVGFKSADMDSPRDRAIADASIISLDTKRVFKEVFGFLPTQESNAGVWAAYNSLFIYLSKK